MDGWIDGLRFYVLFNSIQSYQDDVWMMMKGCVQWNLVYAVYGKEGDNIVEKGKVLGFSQSFLDNLYEMHERMTSIFTSFSTVFQSYRDNSCNEKLCAKRIPFPVEICALAEMELGMARLHVAGQRLTYSYRDS